MKSVRLLEVKMKSTLWQVRKTSRSSSKEEPPRDKNQRAFVGGSWSDSSEEDDEKIKTRLVLTKYVDNKVIGVTFSEHDSEITKDGKVIGRGIRKKGLYVMKLGNKPKDKIFYATIDENSTLWHRRLGHANMRLIQSLAFKESKNHPLENVIGNLNQRTLRSQAQNQSNFFCFISTIEHKNVNEALGDKSWIVAMQEELNQFIANKVWELVPQPKNMTIIGTKWVFRNKLDGNNVVSRNKARILLAYACALDFKLFQRIGKKLIRTILFIVEVYWHTPGFIDFEKPDLFNKSKESIYGLKQHPKLCFKILSLLKYWSMDIIFGSTCQDMCDEFTKIMHDEFEMSMMGELNLFLGLQIKQIEDGIFFNQSKYIKEMLKTFGLEDSKLMKTPMSSDTKLTKDKELSAFVPASKRLPKPLTLKRLSVSSDTLKFSKKQTALAISTTKAEYVSTRRACQQALWMKQALIDYDV
ncbi:retrovirus-related pol polyprotein from transposon TNT 1-94 [Tanacetum coccineum]